MLNASDKLWINENNTVEELPFPDMTCLGNQYKSDSEYDYPHEKINRCLTDINRCLTDIFKI